MASDITLFTQLLVRWSFESCVGLTHCPMDSGAQRGVENKEGPRQASYPSPSPESRMDPLALLDVYGLDTYRLALTPLGALPDQGLPLPSQFRVRRLVVSHHYWQFQMI